MVGLRINAAPREEASADTYLQRKQTPKMDSDVRPIRVLCVLLAVGEHSLIRSNHTAGMKDMRQDTTA